MSSPPLLLLAVGLLTGADGAGGDAGARLLDGGGDFTIPSSRDFFFLFFAAFFSALYTGNSETVVS